MFRYVIGIEKQINKKDITSNSGNLYSLFYLIRNMLKKIEVSWNWNYKVDGDKVLSLIVDVNSKGWYLITKITRSNSF